MSCLVSPIRYLFAESWSSRRCAAGPTNRVGNSPVGRWWGGWVSRSSCYGCSEGKLSSLWVLWDGNRQKKRVPPMDFHPLRPYRRAFSPVLILGGPPPVFSTQKALYAPTGGFFLRILLDASRTHHTHMGHAPSIIHKPAYVHPLRPYSRAFSPVLILGPPHRYFRPNWRFFLRILLDASRPHHTHVGHAPSIIHKPADIYPLRP